jgi:hypothetical protein
MNIIEKGIATDTSALMLWGEYSNIELSVQIFN